MAVLVGMRNRQARAEIRSTDKKYKNFEVLSGVERIDWGCDGGLFCVPVSAEKHTRSCWTTAKAEPWAAFLMESG
ncbi:MAG: hypothetical protein QM757_43275 [Paludibaculum sp.]